MEIKGISGVTCIGKLESSLSEEEEGAHNSKPLRELGRLELEVRGPIPYTENYLWWQTVRSDINEE